MAYEAENLAFSSMSAPIAELIASKHIYYRQSVDSASLNYYATTELDYFDTDGAPSENYSRLGVSGRYSMNDYMPIDTVAQYNIQSIESSARDADYLSITLSLQKKTDTPSGGSYTAAVYQNISSINDYWGAVQRDSTTHEVTPDASGSPVTVDGTTNLRIVCGNYDEIITVPENSSSVTIVIPKDAVGQGGFIIDENGYIFINIGFNALTGDDFTEYANYRVNLRVRLLEGNSGDVIGSYAEDYLIYTNAKVNHDFLKLN